MGVIFKAPAFLIWSVSGFWGFFICFGIVQDALGTAVAVISLFFFPFLLVLAPWYAGLALGDWFPMVVTYGGGIAAFFLYGIGDTIDDHW